MLTAPTPPSTVSTTLFRQPLLTQPSRKRLAVFTLDFKRNQVVPPLKSPSQQPLSRLKMICTVSPIHTLNTTSTVFMTIQPRLHPSPLPAKPSTRHMNLLMVSLDGKLNKVVKLPSSTAMDLLKLLLSPLLPLLLFPSPWSDPAQMQYYIKFSSLDSGIFRCHSMNLRIYFKLSKLNFYITIHSFLPSFFLYLVLH